MLSILLIVFLSPVEDKNKPLDEIEATVYRKRAIIITMVEVVLSILFGILHISNLLSAIVICIHNNECYVSGRLRQE